MMLALAELPTVIDPLAPMCTTLAVVRSPYAFGNTSTRRWRAIKRKTGAADAKRGKIFTQLIGEISTAARIGGGDPHANPRLRLAVDKARGANMAKDTIERAIKKGTGGGDGAAFEEVVYEGYGPGGTAIYVEAQTDNKNRTVGDVRHVLTKHGGNLG